MLDHKPQASSKTPPASRSDIHCQKGAEGNLTISQITLAVSRRVLPNGIVVIALNFFYKHAPETLLSVTVHNSRYKTHLDGKAPGFVHALF